MNTNKLERFLIFTNLCKVLSVRRYGGNVPPSNPVENIGQESEWARGGRAFLPRKNIFLVETESKRKKKLWRVNALFLSIYTYVNVHLLHLLMHNCVLWKYSWKAKPWQSFFWVFQKHCDFKCGSKFICKWIHSRLLSHASLSNQILRFTPHGTARETHGFGVRP